MALALPRRMQLPSVRLKNQGKVYAEISAHILRSCRGEYLDAGGDCEGIISA
jgi:hypothetical protein